MEAFGVPSEIRRRRVGVCWPLEEMKWFLVSIEFMDLLSNGAFYYSSMVVLIDTVFVDFF